MKLRLSFFILLIISITMPTTLIAHAQCLVNEDWPDAPCLDEIINGKFNQEQVNRWAEYYNYKGTIFMEEKRSELEQAIHENTLQEWVDESIQNRNVYDYYFFSGRAPALVGYSFGFEEFMKNESSTIHDPYTDDERYKLASNKVELGGLGIDPDFNIYVIIAGILSGVGIGIGLMLFWRKRK